MMFWTLFGIAVFIIVAATVVGIAMLMVRQTKNLD